MVLFNRTLMPIWEYTAHSLTYMYFSQVPMRLVDIFFPFNLRKFSPTTNNSSKLCYHVIIVRIVPLLQSSLYICANSNINARQRMPFFYKPEFFSPIVSVPLLSGFSWQQIAAIWSTLEVNMLAITRMEGIIQKYLSWQMTHREKKVIAII